MRCESGFNSEHNVNMHLAPFPLDQWLEQANEPGSPVEYDLAASNTGPQWTLRQILALDPDTQERMLDERLVYSTPAGLPELRASIAAAHDADPDDVIAVKGAVSSGLGSP